MIQVFDGDGVDRTVVAGTTIKATLVRILDAQDFRAKIYLRVSINLDTWTFKPSDFSSEAIDDLSQTFGVDFEAVLVGKLLSITEHPFPELLERHGDDLRAAVAMAVVRRDKG